MSMRWTFRKVIAALPHLRLLDEFSVLCIAWANLKLCHKYSAMGCIQFTTMALRRVSLFEQKIANFFANFFSACGHYNYNRSPLALFELCKQLILIWGLPVVCDYTFENVSLPLWSKNLVNSNVKHESKTACSWLRWGSMSMGEPSKNH